MNVGPIFVVSVALVSLANVAQASYERTADGKVKVWHNTPERRVRASWSGDRDDNGYATGKGTLTWFRIQRTWETGTLLPKTKYIEVSQYTGKMVEGKLEGSVVSLDAKGNTYHAKFADGEKTGDWVAGAVPSSRKRAQSSETAGPQVAESPVEAPSPEPKKLTKHTTPEAPEPSPAPKESESVPPPTEASPHAADSLQALAKPPSSLRIGGATEISRESSTPTVDVGEQSSSTSSASSAQSTPAPAENSLQSDDARAVAALDSEYHAAVKTNDASTIDRILADDFVLVHGAGQTFNKSDVLKQARDKQVKYEHHDVQPGTQKVRVWRDTAVVTETLWVKGSQNGVPVDQKMSVTETYARTPNGWRYVSGQASVPE